jgi:hypothetical protein
LEGTREKDEGTKKVNTRNVANEKRDYVLISIKTVYSKKRVTGQVLSVLQAQSRKVACIIKYPGK